MLDRVYEKIQDNNPEIAVAKKYSMPIPQVARIGTTKT